MGIFCCNLYSAFGLSEVRADLSPVLLRKTPPPLQGEGTGLPLPSSGKGAGGLGLLVYLTQLRTAICQQAWSLTVVTSNLPCPMPFTIYSALLGHCFLVALVLNSFTSVVNTVNR
ncbi:hypothetical protein [Tolypothrix sp. VBCCA 56010]|uniref:hypothetical protein n=1 Tax=Tolypothrix sp. VBCCA 56010 TaxID=3137731 RepID=UPI003D7D3B25